MKTSTCSAALFLFVVSVYMIAPTVQFTDTKFSMLLSQSIVSKGSFRIDSILPVFDENMFANTKKPPELTIANGHLYYYFPNATPLLTAPYVAFMNLFDISAIDDQGNWNTAAEVRIQRGAASILAALAVTALFTLASCWLPAVYSLGIALVAAFGTQMFSIASRALWSHDWGVLILLGVIIHLVAAGRKGKINPYLLASLVSWLYFIRPPHNVNVLAISVYVVINYRKQLIPFALTGLSWLGVFIAYSEYNFGTLIPAYFLPKAFGVGVTFSSYLTAILGNLLSPSRGILIFSPFWVVVIYILVRFWSHLRDRSLVLLAMSVSTIHLLLVSGSFTNWWGGHTYGPRMLTDILPWMFLLAIFALDAWRRACLGEFAGCSISRIQKGITGGILILCIAFSFFTHGWGAFFQEAHGWNVKPVNVDLHPERPWDWSDPQFLRR